MTSEVFKDNNFHIKIFICLRPTEAIADKKHTVSAPCAFCDLQSIDNAPDTFLWRGESPPRKAECIINLHKMGFDLCDFDSVSGAELGLNKGNEQCSLNYSSGFVAMAQGEGCRMRMLLLDGGPTGRNVRKLIFNREFRCGFLFAFIWVEGLHSFHSLHLF